jgi:hypothetical protein
MGKCQGVGIVDEKTLEPTAGKSISKGAGQAFIRQIDWKEPPY